MPRTTQIGKEAEQQAAAYLQSQGLQLLECNYHCRGGELDLILRDGDTLVFTEVRFRKQQHFGGALASVDHHKQQRLIRAAQHYLQTHKWKGPCRFDVVGMSSHKPPDWVRNAFEAG